MIRYTRYCLLTFFFFSSSMVSAQIMNDLGMVGGSGLVFTPTIGVTPEAHFRVDASRISFLRSGDGGVNSVGITSGLSENMEFTAEFQSAQAGESISPSFIGFGGKFVLPITLPFQIRTAIWAEKVSTSNPNMPPFFHHRSSGEGSFWHLSLIEKINGNILLGITDADNTKKFAAGCNVSHIVNGCLKIGGEHLYNYYGRNDRQESMSFLFA